jgi:hypothetical protein
MLHLTSSINPHYIFIERLVFELTRWDKKNEVTTGNYVVDRTSPALFFFEKGPAAEATDAPQP